MILRKAFIVPAAAMLMFASGADAQIADIAKAQAADPLAPYIKASSWVVTAKGPTFVELAVAQQEAALRVREGANQNPKLEMLSSPWDVLKLLADKRMEFLWQPLSEWAGPNLEKMREQRLTQLRLSAAAGDASAPSSDTSESTVRPKIRAVLQLAEFLIDIGRSEEAENMLQRQLASIEPRKDGSWKAIEWFSVAAWIGSARQKRNDFQGAIAEYALVERRLGNSPYAANATINRAALLVESGHYAQGLAVIDPLWERWSRDNREYKIGGSNRQFAWIRACSLEGLGRHAEADAAFQPVLDSNDTNDPHYVVETDDSLKLRGLVCMKRTSAVIQLLGNQLNNDLSPDGLLFMQPEYRPQRDAEFWNKVRSDPTLIAVARQRMRVLPEEMTPALNGWR